MREKWKIYKLKVVSLNVDRPSHHDGTSSLLPVKIVEMFSWFSRDCHKSPVAIIKY